jgi:hypothetical protein
MVVYRLVVVMMWARAKKEGDGETFSEGATYG